MYITAYVKPTNSCNLKCHHCFVKEEDKEKKDRMTLEDIRIIAEKMAEIATFLRKKMVKFILHGGEPTIMGPSFISNAADILRAPALASGLHAEVSLQSNLAWLNEEWIPVIKDTFHGGVGTSYDIDIRTINGDAERFDKKWKESVSMLTGAGIRVSATLTMTRIVYDRYHSDPSGFLNFLKTIKWIEAFTFERFTPVCDPLMTEWNKKLYLYNDEYYGFMKNLLAAYLSEGGLRSDLRLRYFDTMYQSVNVRHAGFHNWNDDCFKNTLVINPDGSVSNCPNSYSTESFGNIYTDNIRDILYCPGRAKTVAFQKATFCDDCKWITVCNSGCPLHKRYRLEQSLDVGTECKAFFKALSEINPKDLYGESQGTDPCGPPNTRRKGGCG